MEEGSLFSTTLSWFGWVITWVATAATLWGARFSWVQAKAAKKSATEAEEMRDSIVSKKDTTELHDIRAILNKAISTMDKYAPGARPTFGRGFNTTKESNPVREFTNALALHKNMLRKIFRSC